MHATLHQAVVSQCWAVQTCVTANMHRYHCRDLRLLSACIAQQQWVRGHACYPAGSCCVSDGLSAKLGTIHKAFALQHVINKHKHAKEPLYLCLVDLKSAHDKVQWQRLWRLLQRLVTHGDMLAAIQSLYGGWLLSVRVGGACGHAQSPSIGSRQGCPLIATLFGIYADDLHHHLQTTWPDAVVDI